MKRYPSLLILAATLGLSATAHGAIVTNLVDSTSGWTNIGGGSYSTGVGGLTPQVGTQFWTASIGSSLTRGLYQEFSSITYTYGTTYTATFSVGDRSDVDFGSGSAYFFADTAGDGYTFSDVITTTGSRAQSGADPVSGWQTWTLTTTITEGVTKTNGGVNVTSADQLGFVFLFTTPSGLSANRSSSFDNLVIVPEPATYAMLLGMLALVGAAIKRRHR